MRLAEQGDLSDDDATPAKPVVTTY
jgi:hypothetical protein